MKKILVIAPYTYLPFQSGGQKFIAQFLDWLGKDSNLTVISTIHNEFSKATNYRGLAWLKQSFWRYTDRTLINKISSLVKEEQFQTVIWEHPYFSWLANRVKKRTGVQTIIHTHNIEYQRFRSTARWWWPVLERYEKSAFRRADKIFFITANDREFAIKHWNIDPSKCIPLPYGIEINQYPTNRQKIRELIAGRHSIPSSNKIILFSGALDYPPNLDALKVILETINPDLLANSSFEYKIIVCGKGLPAAYDSLKAYAASNVIYTGFVTDISNYNEAADIVLNPVQSGGGIKTKMVEGIAYGATVISTEAGAAGMDRQICGDKLVVVADNDWKKFADAIISVDNNVSTTPDAFYSYFYWENIIQRILGQI